MQSLCEQIDDGFSLFSGSGNGLGYKKPEILCWENGTPPDPVIH